MVGHDPDDLRFGSVGLQRHHGEAGDDAHQDLPFDVEALGEDLCHILGLHRDDDHVRFRSHLLRGLVHAYPVGLPHANAGLLGRGARHDLVLGEHFLLDQPAYQRFGHLACANESDSHASPYFFTVDNTVPEAPRKHE